MLILTMTIDAGQIQSTVKTYILEQFVPLASPADLMPATRLIHGGVLDSLGTIRLAAFLEREFDIEVKAHEVCAQNLDTLERIADFVLSKQSDVDRRWRWPDRLVRSLDGFRRSPDLQAIRW